MHLVLCLSYNPGGNYCCLRAVVGQTGDLVQPIST